MKQGLENAGSKIPNHPKKKKSSKLNPQNTGSKKHQSKHVYTANN